MNRREAITAAGAGFVTGLLPAEAQATPMPHGVKGFIVFTQEIGQLPPHKAEALLERIKDKLAKKKPELWELIIRPTRLYGQGKVEVFIVDGEAHEAEKFIYDTKTDRLGKIDRTEDYTEEKLGKIRDYVKMMCGAPVMEMPAGMEEMTDYFIEKGLKYEVNNLQQFVYHSVQEHITVCLDGINLDSWAMLRFAIDGIEI
jgi:hypothetical protein